MAVTDSAQNQQFGLHFIKEHVSYCIRRKARRQCFALQLTIQDVQSAIPGSTWTDRRTGTLHALLMHYKSN